MSTCPRTVALSCVLLASCTSRAIDDRASSEISQARADTAAAVVDTSCMNGAKFDGNCGLIARVMGTDRFRERFRQAFCATTTDTQCQQKYERMFNALLRKRYFGADFEAIALDCDASPGACDEPAGYEMKLLDSHNNAVRIRGAIEEGRIEETRRRRQREHVAAQWELVGEAAYLLHKGPKCRSYPSVFGGTTNTICDP